MNWEHTARMPILDRAIMQEEKEYSLRPRSCCDCVWKRLQPIVSWTIDERGGCWPQGLRWEDVQNKFGGILTGDTRLWLGLNQLFLRPRYITVKAQPKDKSSIWKMRQRQIVWGHKILILGQRWSKIVDRNRKLWETPRPTAACPITRWIALLPVELPQEKILQQACSPKTPSQILRKLTLREKHSEEISRG